MTTAHGLADGEGSAGLGLIEAVGVVRREVGQGFSEGEEGGEEGVGLIRRKAFGEAGRLEQPSKVQEATGADAAGHALDLMRLAPAQSLQAVVRGGEDQRGLLDCGYPIAQTPRGG